MFLMEKAFGFQKQSNNEIRQSRATAPTLSGCSFPRTSHERQWSAGYEEAEG